MKRRLLSAPKWAAESPEPCHDTKHPMNAKMARIQPEQIEQVILLIRGQRVMLDRDLAALYGVETKNLNKAVQRNLDRFPADFMFQLTPRKRQALRFQFGTLKRGHSISSICPASSRRRASPCCRACCAVPAPSRST